MELLNKSLTFSKDAKTVVKLSKAHCGLAKVTFLGLVLTAQGWSLSEKFTKSVSQAAIPTTLTELRGFLGLLHWQ